MSDLLRCSCGSTTFYRSYRARGTWTQLVVANDIGGVDVEESFTDDLRDRREPKTMQCTDCEKRAPNPDYKETNH